MQRDEECARICEVIRRHPIIWNKNSQKRGRRNYEWQSVTTELGIEKEQVQPKWRMYRDLFNKDMKRLPKLRPDQDITEYLKPKYRTNRYFKYCLFLADHSKSGLTPAQINGDEEIPYESNWQNLMLQNSDGNGLALGDIHSVINIDNDKCNFNHEGDEFLTYNGNNTKIHENSKSFVMPELQCPVDEYANSNQNNIDSGNHVIGNDIEISDSNSSQSSKANADTSSTTNPESFGGDENSLFLRSLLPYLRQLDRDEQTQVCMNFEEVMIGALLNRTS